MSRRRPSIGEAAVLAVLCLTLLGTSLVACSTTISGTASRGFFQSAGPSPAPDATAPQTSSPPDESDPTPDPALNCPTVNHVAAKLRYRCLTTGMTPGQDSLWPVVFVKPVETSWWLDEGSGLWGPLDGDTLADVTVDIRGREVDAGSYGPTPAIKTLAAKNTTIDGHPAHILQTRFTIDPTYVKERKLKVRTEVSWIVAISIDATSASVWFVSVPDEAASLMPAAAALATSIVVLP
ncbi:hypothetical protein SAMN05892883_2470 [Jatrophihabitans sp. GAS493]|uniref:hypothetical protein n=1 Tax=Jatrophihabitans sp. GAS493 TaxID=1907575 RepID=UPI000BB8740B|nr:hypothetical protein [Jatrophihabitans sp. GAS493]SOD73181.1 hypothetical protein SAMN05892883_2470 [Jatrophihabitans sp. GAS493]